MSIVSISSLALITLVVKSVIVITRAEDIVADNSSSPRAQPKDEYYYRHHIQGNGL